MAQIDKSLSNIINDSQNSYKSLQMKITQFKNTNISK